MTVALIIDNALGANFANERAHNIQSLIIGGSGLPVGQDVLEAFGEVFLQGPVHLGLGGEGIGPIVPISQPENLGLGDNNDLVLDDDTGILRVVTNAGGSTVTGLTGGIDGRIIRIAKFGAGDLTIPNEDAASAAANRFSLPGGNGVVLAAVDTPGGITVQYDGSTSRWIRIT